MCALANTQSQFDFSVPRFLAENKTNKGDDDEPPEELEKSKSELFNISSSAFSDLKEDKVLPFFDANEEEFLKSTVLKDPDMEDEGEIKPTITARDLFGKWGDEPTYPTSYPTLKEKSRRDQEEAEPVAEEEPFRSRKHGSKKEEKAKKKEKKDKSRRSPSPSPKREKDRPLFPGAFPPRAESPLRLAASREEFEQKVTSLGLDELPRYSDNPRVSTSCHIKASML